MIAFIDFGDCPLWIIVHHKIAREVWFGVAGVIAAIDDKDTFSERMECGGEPSCDRSLAAGASHGDQWDFA